MTLRVAGGVPIAVEREVVHREVDQAVGELRRPLRVVPRLEVTVTPERRLTTPGRSACPGVEVTLVSHAERPLTGRLEPRESWGGAAPRAIPFEIPAHGRLLLAAPQGPCPARPGQRWTTTYVGVLDGGGEEAAAYPVIDYPHVRPTPQVKAAIAELVPLDLVWPEVGPVGYVEGASDRVPGGARRGRPPGRPCSASTISPRATSPASA